MCGKKHIVATKSCYYFKLTISKNLVNGTTNVSNGNNNKWPKLNVLNLMHQNKTTMKLNGIKVSLSP